MGFWQYVVQFIICRRVCTEAVAKPNGHEEELCSRGASFLSGETSACRAGSRESEESVCLPYRSGSPRRSPGPSRAGVAWLLLRCREMFLLRERIHFLPSPSKRMLLQPCSERFHIPCRSSEVVCHLLFIDHVTSVTTG